MRFVKVICCALILAFLSAALPIGPAALAAPEYYIEVDITNQYVTVFRASDKAIVRQMICSTGASGTSTPTGTFTMPAKRYSGERQEWYKIGGIWVKYASRIYKGILFHSYLFNAKSDSKPNQTSIKKLGSRASHGCVRLRVADAKWIAQNCPPGTRVKVYKSGKTDSYLRALLLEGTYSIDSGLTHGEFACMSNDPNIWGRGRKGDDVKQLQRRLTALGFLDSAADGVYGPSTISAVRAFQKSAGIHASGFGDPETRDAIFADTAPTGTSATLYIGVNGPAVANLQRSLRSLKLYAGDADGDYDAELAEAVKLFQRAYGYTVNGKASGALQRDAAARAAALGEQFGDGEYEVTVTETTLNMARVKGASRLNLRAKASTSSKSLAKLTKGTEVIVLSRGKSWTKVLYGTREGYLKNSYLTFFTRNKTTVEYAAAELPPIEEELLGMDGLTDDPTADPTDDPTADPTDDPTADPTDDPTTDPTDDPTEDPVGVLVELAKVHVSAGTALRDGASEDAGIVVALEDGSVLEVLERDDVWTKVAYRGLEGYVLNADVEFYLGEKPSEPPLSVPEAPSTPGPEEQPTEEPTDPTTEEPTDEPTEEPTDPPAEEPTKEPAEEPTAKPTTDGDDGAPQHAEDDAA